MLLGEPADRDRPVLLVGVDAEEADASLLEIAGDLGQPRGIGLGQGALGPEEGQDDDLPVAGLVERVPGSPVVLESEADRRLRRFARPDQADQRHDPDQPGSAHRPALCIPSPIPEPRVDHTTGVREVPRIRSGSGHADAGRGAGPWPSRRPAAEGRPGRVSQGSRAAGRRAIVSSGSLASARADVFLDDGPEDCIDIRAARGLLCGSYCRQRGDGGRGEEGQGVAWSTLHGYRGIPAHPNGSAAASPDW